MRRSCIFLLLLWACAPDNVSAPAEYSVVKKFVMTVSEYPQIVGAGDIADCNKLGSKDERTAIWVDSVLQQNPESHAVALGDNAYYHGAYAEYMNCYDPVTTWGRFKARTWFVPGNHEYNQDTSAAGYYKYVPHSAPDTVITDSTVTDSLGNDSTVVDTTISTASDSTDNGVPGRGYHWHILGGWLLMFANSERNFTDQTNWITRLMAAHPEIRCQALLNHEPYNTPDVPTRTGELIPKQTIKPWLVAFWRGRGDLVMESHQHLHLNTYNVRPDTAKTASRGATVMDTSGYRVFIEGGGGQQELTPLYPMLPWHRKMIRDWGITVITLLPTSYRWQRIGLDGTIQDAGSRGCH